jgi:hypothetical protein
VAGGRLFWLRNRLEPRLLCGDSARSFDVSVFLCVFFGNSDRLAQARTLEQWHCVCLARSDTGDCLLSCGLESRRSRLDRFSRCRSLARAGNDHRSEHQSCRSIQVANGTRWARKRMHVFSALVTCQRTIISSGPGRLPRSTARCRATGRDLALREVTRTSRTCQ